MNACIIACRDLSSTFNKSQAPGLSAPNPGTVQQLKKACPAKAVVGPQGRQLIYPVEAELPIAAIHRRGKIRRVESGEIKKYLVVLCCCFFFFFFFFLSFAVVEFLSDMDYR